MKEVTKKGFTLIELLIVIAILGVLAAAVTIILNPAELLAQARDGQRISDMDTVRTAINTYLSQVTTTPNLDLAGYSQGGTAYGGGGCSATSSSVVPFGYASTTAGLTPIATSSSAATVRLTTGVGWVDVNLASLPGGSPLAVLPVDPVNTGNYAYCYVGDNTAVAPNYSFKLATRLESVKFGSKEIQYDASTSTIACVPGGSPSPTDAHCFYQVGTNLGL
jgi:prepilin-type N-terminal cleavage/methylation domain-containing protein